MFGSGTTDVPNIMDSITVDGTTIIIENGGLKINPDIELGGGLDYTALQDYLTQNSYLNVLEADSRYLPLTGGTMSGVLTFDYKNNQYAYITQVNNRATETGGGWAIVAYRFLNAAKEQVGSIGTRGDKNVLSYIYIGHNNYGEDNLRIYSDKVTFGDAALATINDNVASATKLKTPRTIW